MKILVERKPYENWSLEVDCDGLGWSQGDKVPCSSTLEIDANDLVKRNWHKYPNNNGMDYGFVCPVCQCFTVVEESKLNGHLQNMAKDYKE